MAVSSSSYVAFLKSRHWCWGGRCNEVSSPVGLSGSSPCILNCHSGCRRRPTLARPSWVFLSELKFFIPLGRQIRERLEEERAQQRRSRWEEPADGEDKLEFHVAENKLRDAQMGYLERMRTNTLPLPYQTVPDTINEALIEFVLTGAIRLS